VWLSRYPQPQKVLFDNGSEFKKDFIPLLKDFGVKPRPTTVKNPQSNSIVECVHQVLGNMLHTFELETYDFDDLDPWGEILASVAWAIHSTYHTTLDATPGQLVFGRDMILGIQHIADWEHIRLRKQWIIDDSNSRENRGRVQHDYAVGDKVLIHQQGVARNINSPTEGPYEILQVFTNGTVLIQRGAIHECMNI
jgi:transposase InsO family protein